MSCFFCSCGLPAGLDRNFWMNHRCSGRQLGVVPKAVTHGVPRISMKTVRVARSLALPPDAVRLSRVSPCQKFAIRCPKPKVASCLSERCDDLQETRGAGTRGCASSSPARWQRGWQRVQRRKRTVAGAVVRTGGSWTSTPPFALTDRSFGMSRRKVGKVAPGATTSQLDNVIKLRFGHSSSGCSTVLLPLVEDVEIVVKSSRIPTTTFSREFSNAIPASCSNDGSLAVIQPLWLRKTSEVSSMLERVMPAPVWEGVAAQHTLLNQPHMAAVILILLVTYMRPSELLA